MKSNRNEVTPARLALVALAGIAMGLSGCGRSDDDAAAIRQATIDLETLAATYQPGQGGKTSYQQVVSSLDDAADGSGGQAAAARVLRSVALVRQGDEAAIVVAELERRVQGMSTTIRRFQDQWLDLEAQAAALRGYDPTEDLTKIDQQISAKSQEIEQTRAALAQAEQEHAALRRSAEEALAKSRAQRDQELALRAQMVDKSQTARAELVRQANEVKREGDGYDVQAADFMAQSGRYEPQIAELRMRLERLEAQKVMLGASKDQVRAAEAQAEEQARRAHAGVVGAGGKIEYVGAQQVGEELTKAVAELREARAELDGPTDEANRLYDQALSEVQRAKAAGGGGRGAGDTRLAEAAVRHAQADLLLVRTRGLQAHASLMNRLATTKPALPGAAEYAKEAAEAAEAAGQQAQSARDAFTAARDLYEAAGQSQKAQDVKDRLELVAQSLTAFAAPRDAEPTEPTETGDETGEAAAVPGVGTEGEAETAAAPAATFEGAQAEVQDLIKRVADTMNAKDYEALIPMIVFRNSRQEETFRKLLPVMTKMDALDQACLDQFGRDFSTLSDEFRRQRAGTDRSGANQSRADQEMLRLRAIDPADIEIRMLAGGTEAEVRRRSARTEDPVDAMKVGEEWKLKLDYELEGGIAPDAFMKAFEKALDATLEKVKSGMYASDTNRMIEDFGSTFVQGLLNNEPVEDDNK